MFSYVGVSICTAQKTRKGLLRGASSSPCLNGDRGVDGEGVDRRQGDEIGREEGGETVVGM